MQLLLAIVYLVAGLVTAYTIMKSSSLKFAAPVALLTITGAVALYLGGYGYYVTALATIAIVAYCVLLGRRRAEVR